jgi:hypothetical protein
MEGANMTTNETNQETENQQEEAVAILYRHVHQVLEREFEGCEVSGQVGEHPVYGPIFAYSLKHEENVYSCGFFFNELLHNFQNNANPALWLSSFFVDLIRDPQGRPLPNPPQSEDEAKALIDKNIVPYCAQTVRDEFSEHKVYVDLELHPEQGPVLEAGFPSISEGNNTCAMPLQFLLTLYLLNRDPADPLIQALYKILDV